MKYVFSRALRNFIFNMWGNQQRSTVSILFARNPCSFLDVTSPRHTSDPLFVTWRGIPPLCGDGAGQMSRGDETPCCHHAMVQKVSVPPSSASPAPPLWPYPERRERLLITLSPSGVTAYTGHAGRAYYQGEEAWCKFGNTSTSQNRKRRVTASSASCKR